MIETCPSEELLRQFNEGRIDASNDVDRITEHLGSCESCIDKLEAMEPGPIAEGLRESAASQLMKEETLLVPEDQNFDSIQGTIDDVLSTVRNNPSSEQLDPTQFGENRYQVIGAIGEGDFSCVYGALGAATGGTDETHDLLAIKIPHDSKLTTDRHAQQFFLDCKKSKLLEHPNIQPVLDYGRWDEKKLFLTKPLLQHPTLTTLSRNRIEFNYATTLSIIKQIVNAVFHAHSKHVVHRHLSPNNIHLVKQTEAEKLNENYGDYQAIVSDFGFTLDSRYHFDLIEPLQRKDPFVSPESDTQNVEFIDDRTDVYSLGKILKLLTRLTPDLQEEDNLKKIIEKSTTARRRERYQSVGELRFNLGLL
ncbi:protein kinase [bacterium]|nr:protein kinase [bacterium]MDA7911762.1 protein kinase [bacterium]